MAILKCDKITKKFGGLVALDQASFSVSEGEIIGLIGPNGAGKTTLFNVIAGLYHPTSGRVIFNGEVISNYPPHKICKRRIARTFQIPQPFKGLSVLENVAIGAIFGSASKKGFDGAKQILDLLGLYEYRDSLVENLTIANQKKVEIAKALATEPRLLLLDEVAAGLNPAEQDLLSEIVLKVHEELRITIILVEHIMRTVMELSHRIIVLEMGKVLKQGDPEEIRTDPEVIEAYIGEDYYEYVES